MQPQKIAITAALALLFTSLTAATGADEEKGLAPEIIRQTGIRGGLCVHLGSDDGMLAVEFAQTGKFLVHGWVTDSGVLAKARASIQSKGVYGQASVERGSLDRLPYADHLVNLVVVDDLSAALKQGLALSEVMRVLAPRGVAYLGQRPGSGGMSAVQLRSRLAEAGIKEVEMVERSGTWAKITNPLLSGADEWTHYNYDPTGNRVSRDTLAGPPGQVRWLDGPSWPTDRNGPNAAVDEHRVLALDATSGKARWSFTAGGRVLVPPTYDKGLCFFGSADGWVYCLRARDGQMVWRYRAAPKERRIVAHGQLESPWPVAGGVLVMDGVAYFAAGRHGSLDDGVYLHAVDSLTGKTVWTKQHQDGPVLGLLLSDGKAVRMSGKAGYTLKTGDRASGVLDSPVAYDPETLSLTHILGANAKTDAARINADIRAVVRCGQTLFAMGWPAEGEPEVKRGGIDRPIANFPEDKPDPKNCQLWAFSAGDGNKLYGMNIGVAPVFDGLAAARERLFLTTQEGKVICFGGK